MLTEEEQTIFALLGWECRVVYVRSRPNTPNYLAVNDSKGIIINEAGLRRGRLADGEFSKLFPKVSFNDLPETILERLKNMDS